MAARTEPTDHRNRADVPGGELAPWVTEPLPWLRRLVVIRLFVFLPLILALLVAAEQGQVDSPTAVFSVILSVAFLNLLLFLGARRLAGDARRLAGLMLWSSLLADCLLVLCLAHLLGGIGTPLTLFLLLPLLAAAMATSERATLVLAGGATAALFVLAGLDPAPARAATALPGGDAGGATHGRGTTVAGMTVLLWAVLLAVLWYRRRGRFLESRLALLEEERAAFGARLQSVRQVATRRAVVAPPRAAGPNGRGSVESMAGALAEDLLEPTGVVRARAENVRYQLKDRRELKSLMPDLERVLRAADRLDDARLTLAALARLDSAPATATDVRAVAKGVRDALTREFERDGVRLRIECPQRLPPVTGSHNEIRLVLVRLLDAARRAAQASGRASRVNARFWREEERVILTVDDPFPAPSPEEEWFDPTWSRKERPALGLALAVVKTVAERRGGAVEVRRRKKGGLSVRVSLPVSAVGQRGG